MSTAADEDPIAWLRRGGSSATTQQDHSLGSLEDVFCEEPVTLDVFVRDQAFLRMETQLSDPQYACVRVAERIFLPSLYPRMEAEFGPYWTPMPMKNIITAEVGKGGGKDLIARVISLRIAYLLQCMHNPKSYFGMPPDESIHLLNVASTKDQARLAFFEPMTRITKRGWFKDRCDPLQRVIVWDKGVSTISGSSDAETQEGLNLILGVADEVDAFRTAEDVRRTGSSTRNPMRSLESIIEMLESSAKTRFAETFKNVRISYPRYQGSPIKLLREEAEADIEEFGDESRHYAVGPMASWEFNPLLANSEFVEVPGVEVPVPVAYAADFRNPRKRDMARGMYLCQPSRTQRPPYFRAREVVESAQREAEEPRIEVVHRLVRGSWHPVIRIDRNWRPIPGARYAVHGDLALNGDRAGIAVAHVVDWLQLEGPGEDGSLQRWENLPSVHVDAVVAVEADLQASPPREIPLRVLRMLVFELRRRGFPIIRASADGWQSTESRQAFEIAGVLAPRVSLDREEAPWRELREAFEESRCSIPQNALLVSELLGLVRDPKTGKVDHEQGGSKDLADAVCGAYLGAAAIGGMEQPEAEMDRVEFYVDSTSPLPLGLEGWESVRPI